MMVSGEPVHFCFVPGLKGKVVHEVFSEAQEVSGRHVECITFLLNMCFGHFRKIWPIN